MPGFDTAPAAPPEPHDTATASRNGEFWHVR